MPRLVVGHAEKAPEFAKVFIAKAAKKTLRAGTKFYALLRLGEDF